MFCWMKQKIQLWEKKRKAYGVALPCFSLIHGNRCPFATSDLRFPSRHFRQHFEQGDKSQFLETMGVQILARVILDHTFPNTRQPPASTWSWSMHPRKLPSSTMQYHNSSLLPKHIHLVITLQVVRSQKLVSKWMISNVKVIFQRKPSKDYNSQQMANILILY